MFKKIGVGFGILIILIITYNLLGQIFSTLKSGERLQKASERLHQLELKNRELKIRLEEVGSTDFIEREARDRLGLAKEGETVVIIPDEKIDQLLGSQKEEEQKRLPNPLGWWKVFF